MKHGKCFNNNLDFSVQGFYGKQIINYKKGDLLWE